MKRGWVAALLLLGAPMLTGSVAPDAQAYEFLYRYDVVFPESLAENPFRPDGHAHHLWDPEVWPPGRAADVALHDDPRWYQLFEDYDELSAFVQRWGLDPWTNVPTADIRWRLVRVAPDDPSLEEIPFHIVLTDSPGSVAVVSSIRGRGISVFDVVYRCHVVHFLQELSPDSPFHDHFYARERLKLVLMHELGHCLGLDHTGTLRDRQDGQTLEPISSPARFLSAWRTDPIMSYGVYDAYLPSRELVRFVGAVLFDDALGASLVRPRSGWLDRTGTMWGRITLDDGAGAHYVKVIASRLGHNGRMAETVVVLTDLRGYFAMAGLPPGDYFLQVHTIWACHAFKDIQELATIHQTLAPTPYRVRAGESTGPVLLSVQEDQLPGPEFRRCPPDRF